MNAINRGLQISCFEYDRGTCWDLGFVDDRSTAEQCQRACALTPGCEAFSYHPDRGNRRCHFCSNTSQDWTGCTNDENCVFGPANCPGNPEIDFTSILIDSMEIAKDLCGSDSNFPSQDETIMAASDLNFILKNLALHQGETDFDLAFNDAVSESLSILANEDDNCFDTVTGPDASCTYGGVLYNQLRGLVLLDDNYRGVDVFPKERDTFRATLWDDYKVLLADNGWMNSDSLETMIAFYRDLPSHLLFNGVLFDAPFAVNSVRDAFKCGDDTSAGGILGFTKRGYNIFKVQVSQNYEQAFPSDTPEIPDPGDLSMTVLRHEVAHQFDRVVDANPRLKSLMSLLKSESTGDDSNWLRSQVGDDFFQNAPQEIIASQIGNQYLLTTSSQLRLAASRLYQLNGKNSSQDEFNFYLSFENKECTKQDKNLGTNFVSPEECGNAAWNDNECKGNKIMWSNDYNNEWGCRCCSEDEGYFNNDLWDLYQYRGEPRTILLHQEQKCVDEDKNLQTYSSPSLCGSAAYEDNDCSGSWIMWSGVTQECRCCSLGTSVTKDSNWNTYQYKEEIYCPEDVFQCPDGGFVDRDPFDDCNFKKCNNWIPLAWWLFNVDVIADPHGDTSTFYENEVDGYVDSICVKLSRDNLDRIIGIEVPGCGFLSFSYSDISPIVEDASGLLTECVPDSSTTTSVCTTSSPTKQPSTSTLNPTDAVIGLQNIFTCFSKHDGSDSLRSLKHNIGKTFIFIENCFLHDLT